MSQRRHQELHGLPAKVYGRLWLRKIRRENIRSGKTWDGKPRQRAIRLDLTTLSRNQRHAVTNQERRIRLGQATWGKVLTPSEIAAARKRIERAPVITTETEIARLRVRLAKLERLGWLDDSVLALRYQCEAALQFLCERSAEK